MFPVTSALPREAARRPLDSLLLNRADGQAGYDIAQPLYGGPLLAQPGLEPGHQPAILGQPLAVAHLHLALQPGSILHAALERVLDEVQLFEFGVDFYPTG